jgi:L-amino acid N-acyltransferase YncA
MDATIRQATDMDWPGIWRIFRRVVASGDTFSYPPDITEVAAKQLWMMPKSAENPRQATYVVLTDGVIAATAFLKPNAPGLGDHVANAGFMVDPDQGGRGLGRRLAEHILAEARRMNFAAMQFNYVVSSNARAVHLWQSVGFRIIGTLPGAFRHATRGPTDVHVMWREL